MKRVKLLGSILMILIAGMLTNSFAGSEHTFDKNSYDKIAKKTIGRVISGNIDADAMLTDMKKLLALGIEGCKEHMSEPETPANEVTIMKITIEYAEKMTSLSLDEIEKQWHQGGVAKAEGIDMASLDHFSEVLCHYDAVVHPATAIICLNEYKKTNNDELLEQVQDELAEVREHLKHLD